MTGLIRIEDVKAAGRRPRALEAIFWPLRDLTFSLVRPFFKPILAQLNALAIEGESQHNALAAELADLRSRLDKMVVSDRVQHSEARRPQSRLEHLEDLLANAFTANGFLGPIRLFSTAQCRLITNHLRVGAPAPLD